MTVAAALAGWPVTVARWAWSKWAVSASQEQTLSSTGARSLAGRGDEYHCALNWGLSSVLFISHRVQLRSRRRCSVLKTYDINSEVREVLMLTL